MPGLNFRPVWVPDGVTPRTLNKASATVLVHGRFAGYASNLAIVADATTTRLGFLITDGANGDLTVQVFDDPRIVYEGTLDANFAITDRGAIVDMVLSGADQLIDKGASAIDVFRIEDTSKAGVVGSTLDVRIKVNKGLSYDLGL